MTQWFLETSVIRNLLFGHSLFKREIERAICANPCDTSFFVFMEFKRGVIQTLIELYYVVAEEESPADAFHYFSQSFRIRETKTVLSAIGALLLQRDLENNKQKVLVTLERLIRESLIRFNGLIRKFINDKSKCPLAKASIENSYEEFQQQITCEAKCQISQFWKDNKLILEKLIHQGNVEPHRSNKGFSNALPMYEKVIEDPNLGQRKNTCPRLGDTIIAIEMPSSHTMLTFDKSFESLCSILGKDVTRLPSLKELSARETNS